MLLFMLIFMLLLGISISSPSRDFCGILYMKIEDRILLLESNILTWK